MRNVTTYREGQRGVVSGFIKDIAVSKNDIWFATARGVMRHEKGSSRFRIYNKSNSGLADNYVTGIGIDGKQIWFTTANGLSVYNISSNTWKSFKKERGGLTDNYLTCILVDGNYIWIGTRTWGLNRYDKEANQFTKYGEIDGLNSNSIISLAKSGRYIWVGSEGGLNRYDIYSGSWGSYGKDQGLNLPKLRVNAIVPEGNVVWVGTIAGVYKFDANEEKFQRHSLSTVVFGIISDGQFLWVATFDGLYRVNKENQNYQLFTRRNGLIANSINCLAIDSNFLWLGTESPGGGVTRIDKQLPQVEISYRTGYVKKNVIDIYGTIQDKSGIRSYTLSYRSLLIGGDWKTLGLRKVSGPENIVNGKLGRWVINPRKINEETFEIRLTATSKRGIKNSFTYSVIIDKTDPKINLGSVPQAVSKSKFLLEGRFQEANMRSIWIKHGRVKKKAQIKLSGLGGIGTFGGGRFSQIINLNRGKNVIEIIAEDIGKHIIKKKIEINYDISAPIVKFENNEISTSERIYKIIGTIVEENLAKVILQQGNITLHPGGFQGFNIQKISRNEWKFIYQVTLNPGENNFTFIAQDHSNKRGRATIKIKYATDAPRVTFSPQIKTKTKKQKLRVFGTWQDNDLVSIEISNSTNDKKVKAKIDKTKKTFTAEIELKEGPNIINATAVDKAGNVTTITMNDPVKYVKDFQAPVRLVRINEGDSEEVRKIKEELNRLRKENRELRARIAQLERNQGRGSSGSGSPVVIYRGGGPRVPIPPGNQLYFVPYNARGGDKLTRVAKNYLGSSRNYGEIAYFNDETSSTVIRNRRKILVPTRGLLRMIYSGPKPSLIRKVADIIGETYNTLGPGQPVNRYFQQIYNRFKSNIGGLQNMGTIVYNANIAIGFAGMTNIPQLINAMKAKNIKLGLFIIFTGNSVVYKKLVIR